MHRRTYLQAGAALGTASLAGCLGFELEEGGAGEPPLPEDRPNGVYLPSHTEGMETTGTAESGDYAFAVTYSYAHRFWNVNGEDLSFTEAEADDDVHLMTVVWDPETRTVLPETGLSVEILRDGELVSQEVIYPMVSQPMGFHYGGNFPLDGDGTYTVRPSVGGVSIRTTGSFRDRFTEPASAEITFDFSAATRDELPVSPLDDGGSRGAIDPMEMGEMPRSRAPPVDSLPGRVLGEPTTDDVRVATTVLDSPPAGIDADEQYLAVSARSRYNRTVLPAMSLDATVTRGGQTVFDDRLVRTLDSELGYHYGAVVSAVESGDEVTITPRLQPQVARHEGYETAFGGIDGGLDAVSVSVA